MVADDALGEGEDEAFDVEEISDRVVVLKAVESPDGRGGIGVMGGDRFTEKFFQIGEELRARLGFELRFVLGRHLLEVDGIDNLTQEFGVGLQLIERLDLQQVCLALHLAILAVAFDAMGLEDFQHVAAKPRRQGKGENQNKAAENHRSKATNLFLLFLHASIRELVEFIGTSGSLSFASILEMLRF